MNYVEDKSKALEIDTSIHNAASVRNGIGWLLGGETTEEVLLSTNSVPDRVRPLAGSLGYEIAQLHNEKCALAAENASLRARVAELEAGLDAAVMSRFVVQSASVDVMDVHGVVNSYRTEYRAPDPRSEALSRAMRTPGA